VGSLAGWIYCPRCRAQLDGESGSGRVECPECGFAAYASSMPTACALCTDDDGRVLLVRRAGEVFHDYWDLPGGFLDEGEHPLDALRRELQEETGLRVEPETFIGVWIDRYADTADADEAPSTINLYWTARVLDGEEQAADDVSELRWFPANELPDRGEFAFHIADVLAEWRRRTEQSR